MGLPNEALATDAFGHAVDPLIGGFGHDNVS
jgi:hypothetical protein